MIAAGGTIRYCQPTHSGLGPAVETTPLPLPAGPSIPEAGRIKWAATGAASFLAQNGEIAMLDQAFYTVCEELLGTVAGGSGSGMDPDG